MESVNCLGFTVLTRRQSLAEGPVFRGCLAKRTAIFGRIVSEIIDFVTQTSNFASCVHGGRGRAPRGRPPAFRAVRTDVDHLWRRPPLDPAAAAAGSQRRRIHRSIQEVQIHVNERPRRRPNERQTSRQCLRRQRWRRWTDIHELRKHCRIAAQAGTILAEERRVQFWLWARSYVRICCLRPVFGRRPVR